MRNGKFLFTSESMTEGHPDKICDQISDEMLDQIYKEDPQARVACETMVGMGFIIVTGEITTETYVNVQKLVRKVLKEIGYTKPEYGFDHESVGVLTSIHEQSADIALGVDESKKKAIGAGDQGMMSGYATNETPELMPLPILLAHRLAKKLTDVRKNKTLPYLRPDGKSQVKVHYQKGKPKAVEQVVLAVPHQPQVSNEQIKKDLYKKVVCPVLEEFKFKIDMFWRIRDLIKDEMSKRKESIHPQRLKQCLDKVDEEKESLKKQLEKTREERLNLEIELIIGRQKLFFLKKDLEEKSG